MSPPPFSKGGSVRPKPPSEHSPAVHSWRWRVSEALISYVREAVLTQNMQRFPSRSGSTWERESKGPQTGWLHWGQGHNRSAPGVLQLQPPYTSRLTIFPEYSFHSTRSLCSWLKGYGGTYVPTTLVAFALWKWSWVVFILVSLHRA